MSRRRAAWLLSALVAAIGLVVVLTGRRRQPNVHVEALDGESAVLPRASPSAASSGQTHAESRALAIAGVDRRYELIEPEGLDPAERYPLVLVFHGDGGDSRGFHERWPFERASGGGAFVAYLDGRTRTWDLETTKGNPDVAFAEALVTTLAHTHPIDRTRIFAAGYSSGGFFANVLACQRPGLLRAIASNAGGAPYGQLETWPNGYPKCPGQEPTAMLALHGERDSGVALDSGRFSATYWAYVNGCKTDEMETTGYVECHAYRGCPAGKAVGFCSIPNLGHWVWDRSAEAIWTFFERT